MLALAKKKHSTKIGKTKADKITDFCITGILIISSIVCLYPLWYTLIASVSNPAYITNGEVWLLPKGLTTIAYEELYRTKSIWIGYRNSLFYTVTLCFMELLVIIPVSYVLSRPRLHGHKMFFLFFLIPMYFSGGMVPSYLLMSKLGLVNNILVMIIPKGVAAFYLIICRNYFQGNIPESVFESARMDGCSVIQFLIRFVVPLSKPIISVIVMYAAIGTWNDYMTSMIYLQDFNKQSLQVIIRSITATLDESMADVLDAETISMLAQRKQLLKYAVVVVSAIPLILLYPFVQRYLIGGIMVGSVKE